MTNYNFEIFFTGFEELNIELEDAVFEAGCDDGLLGTSESRFSICFGRDAESFSKAVISAIADMQKVPGLHVTELITESESYQHDAEIINDMLNLQPA